MTNVHSSKALMRYIERAGRYATTKRGKILMKSAALASEETLTWRNKPGWEAGELVDLKLYDKWLERVRF